MIAESFYVFFFCVFLVCVFLGMFSGVSSSCLEIFEDYTHTHLQLRHNERTVRSGALCFSYIRFVSLLLRTSGSLVFLFVLVCRDTKDEPGPWCFSFVLFSTDDWGTPTNLTPIEIPFENP